MNGAGKIRAYLRLLRPHYWIKNALLLLPMLEVHRYEPREWLSLALAICSLSFLASAIYIINDWRDLRFDRGHPVKRRRPLAAGEISRRSAAGACALLLAAGLSIGYLPGPDVFGLLLLYLMIGSLYSLYVKKIFLLDALVLALLYWIRLRLGEVVWDHQVSPLLRAGMIALFFSMIAGKRVTEYVLLKNSGVSPASSHGYGTEARFTGVRALGAVAACVSVCLFFGYFIELGHDPFYVRSPVLLLIPLLGAAFLARFWLCARSGRLNEDLVWFLFDDAITRLIAGVMLICWIISAWPP